MFMKSFFVLDASVLALFGVVAACSTADNGFGTKGDGGTTGTTTGTTGGTTGTTGVTTGTTTGTTGVTTGTTGVTTGTTTGTTGVTTGTTGVTTGTTGVTTGTTTGTTGVTTGTTGTTTGTTGMPTGTGGVPDASTTVKLCATKTVVMNPVFLNFENYNGTTAAASYSTAFGGTTPNTGTAYAGLFAYGDGSATPALSILAGHPPSNWAGSENVTQASTWGMGGGVWMGCADASAYKGISFWVRGTSGTNVFSFTLAMESTVMPDATNPAGGGTCPGTTATCTPPSMANIPLTADWTQVTIPWGAFTPGMSGATSVVPDGSNITRPRLGCAARVPARSRDAGGRRCLRRDPPADLLLDIDDIVEFTIYPLRSRAGTLPSFQTVESRFAGLVAIASLPRRRSCLLGYPRRQDRPPPAHSASSTAAQAAPRRSMALTHRRPLRQHGLVDYRNQPRSRMASLRRR